MKKLKSLDIPSRKITDRGLMKIMSLPSLTSLDLCGCHTLTNTSLELISKRMLLLEYIDVTCEKFTIDGVNHLLRLPRLKTVDYDSLIISREDFDTFYSKLSSNSEN